MHQVLLVITLCAAQFGVPQIRKPEHPHTDLQTLPEQRRTDDATMKAEFAKSVAEVSEILRMATEASAAFAKADSQTLPADALKLLAEIEKKAKHVRQRFKK